MPRFSMIEPARSCLKKIRLSFPQNGIFALFDSTYFWRVFFGVLCFQQKLFFFSAFVLLRIEKGAVAELSVLLQLLSYSLHSRGEPSWQPGAEISLGKGLVVDGEQCSIKRKQDCSQFRTWFHSLTPFRRYALPFSSYFVFSCKNAVSLWKASAATGSIRSFATTKVFA